VLNPTYKHLEDAVRVGRFTLGQWAQLLVATLIAIGFGMYLSPLPPTPTISVSVLVGGLPLTLSYAAMGLEFSVLQFARAVVAWARRPRRYVPGAGLARSGYVVHPEAEPPAHLATSRAHGQRLATLWDA
jgi:hypothetical protein